MLHAGRGRSLGHHNRKPQGGGTPTPTPSVGNQLKPANRAQAQTMLSTTAVAGDVIDTNGAWYSPDTGGVFNITRGMGAGAGITFVGNQAEPSQFVANGIANMYIEFVNCLGSSYANGVTPGAASDRSFFFTNCTHFAIHGSKGARGDFPFFIDGCSDYEISNNIGFDGTNDVMRITGTTTRFRVKNNILADPITGADFYWFTDGTAPAFYTDPGGAAGSWGANHPDGIQIFSPTAKVYTDADITDNVLYGWLQGLWLVDENNTFVRLRVNRNDITAALSQALAIGSYVSNAEVSSNIVRTPPTRYPGTTVNNIIFNDNNNTGPFKTDGLNSFPVGTTYNPPVNPAINLTNGVAQGSATAPTAPNFTGTTSNISNLPALRNRPAYTPYSGSPSAPAGFVGSTYGANLIYGPGGALSSYPANAKLTINPPPVRGRTANCEDTYKIRWKSSPSGTIVQAQGTGRSYMVFPAPSTGGSFYAETDVGDGVWVASNVVAVASANSTFQTGLANVTYSNGNLTITKDAGADSDRNGQSLILPTADGKYAWEMTPTLVAGGGMNIGFMDGSGNFLDFNGTSWYFNGGSVRSGFPGCSFDGTQKCLIYMTISGGGTVRKVWLYLGATNGWSATDGDPNSGGTGWDVSSVGLVWATTTAKARVSRAGETVTANFGQNAYGTTVPSGTVGI